MLFIDSTHPDIQFALQEHYRYVRCYVWKKIGAKDALGTIKKCTDPNCPICTKNYVDPYPNLPIDIYTYLNDDLLLEILICGNPEEISAINIDFWKFIFPGFDYYSCIDIVNKKEVELENDETLFYPVIKSKIDALTKIFNYKGWFDANKPSGYYSAYHLATYLSLRSCVYCNRTYTLTQFKTEGGAKIGKLLRPHFDHWFPQEYFPLLALSFFNLVPSCSICNSSVKGRKKFNLTDYVHPYVDNITDSILFSFNYRDSIDSVKVALIGLNDDLALQKRIDNTLEDFHLEEMYEAHEPELLDLIKLKQAYSENYLKTLRNAFPGIKLTDNEMYRLAFGVELDPKDFQKRPFSKFKYDILRELKVI